MIGLGLILGGALLVIGVGSFDTTLPPASYSAVVAPVDTPSVPGGEAVAPTVRPSPTRDPRTPISLGYRIQIPRLGIDLPIAEGDIVRDIELQKTPVNFAFHLPGTAIPGEASNTYLYAHARTGMFLSLWKALPGDQVFISTPDLKVLQYVIVETHPRVAYDDVSWVQPTSSERLSLQTSTGPNPNDPRYLAVAVPAP